MALIQVPILREVSNVNYARYAWNYAGDWATAIALIAGAAYLQFFTDPFHRQFHINDPTINFPFATTQQFDDARLLRYSVLLPLAVFTVWHVLRFVKSYGSLGPNAKRELTLKTIHIYHILILSFIVGLSLNGFVTEFLKNAISKPRPDFIARCGVDAKLIVEGKINYDSSVCSKPLGEALFKDGFKSSPSGHSSFAFTGLGYLSLWLAGQLKILAPDEGKRYKPVYIKVIPLIPVLIACKIAISRTQDYRHHFKDILLGSAIGILNCYFNYFWFFNRLDDKLSDAVQTEDDYKLLSAGGPDKPGDQLESHELDSMV